MNYLDLSVFSDEFVSPLCIKHFSLEKRIISLEIMCNVLNNNDLEPQTQLCNLSSTCHFYNDFLSHGEVTICLRAVKICWSWCELVIPAWEIVPMYTNTNPLFWCLYTDSMLCKLLGSKTCRFSEIAFKFKINEIQTKLYSLSGHSARLYSNSGRSFQSSL